MKTLKIGNVELENRYILAPMAGVSDLPFRLLCKEQGAGLVCMEMVSAKAIYYNNKNTDMLMEIHPDEGAVSLQLFGSDPKIMGEMAKRIEERTGVETRATILGYLQRGGSPTVKDRLYASIMGAKAVDLIVEGKLNRVVGYRGGEYIDFDITDALKMNKEIPEYQLELSKIL